LNNDSTRSAAGEWGAPVGGVFLGSQSPRKAADRRPTRIDGARPALEAAWPVFLLQLLCAWRGARIGKQYVAMWRMANVQSARAFRNLGGK
jgi:hypothetical protein